MQFRLLWWMLTMNDISVIIPMYNEEKGAQKCVQALDQYLSQHFQSYEIVAVNDGSRDRTGEILNSLAKDYPNLNPQGYSTNRGKGCAVRTGVLASKGKRVVCTDCDLAYGVEIIGQMAAVDSPVVIGSRNLTKQGHKGYTPLRRFASKTYIKLLNLAAGFHHTDSQCGIKCYDGEAGRRIFALCRTDGFAFDLEALMIAERLGYDIREQSVCIINHTEEASKVRIFRDTFKMLSDIRKIKKYVKTIQE